MLYNTYKYLFPPRPENALSPDSLVFYEKILKWVFQFKKNGTNTVIFVSPEKEYTIKTRHKTDHKAWSMTDHIKKELTRLFPEKNWLVLSAELLHSKTVEIKDTIYIHDILVFNNELLVGSTFMQRQKILEAHLKTNIETYSHYVCDNQNKVWFAKLFFSNIENLFYSIKDTI